MSDTQREVLPVKVPSDKALGDLAKWNDRNGSLVHETAWYELMELVMFAERDARLKVQRARIEGIEPTSPPNPLNRKTDARIICDLRELGDTRELAKDGSVGDGSDCFNNLDHEEKATFYKACRNSYLDTSPTEREEGDDRKTLDAIAANAPSCPQCNSNIVSVSFADESFEYGTENPVTLTTVVTVYRCCNGCDFAWTDHAAEVARDAAVQIHLLSQHPPQPERTAAEDIAHWVGIPGVEINEERLAEAIGKCAFRENGKHVYNWIDPNAPRGPIICRCGNPQPPTARVVRHEDLPPPQPERTDTERLEWADKHFSLRGIIDNAMDEEDNG